MAMFRPVLAGRLSASINPTSLDTLLVKCLGFLFTGDLTQEYFRSYNTLINQGMFSKYCARAGSKLKENGVLICVSVLSGLLEFGATNPDGSSRSVILQEYEAMMSRKGSTKPVSPDPSIPGGIDSNERTSSTNQANHACRVAFLVFAAGLDQLDNRNIIPMIHAFTAFLNIATRSPKIMLLIEMEVPWTLLIAYLNHFTRPGTMTRTCLGPNFPKPADDQIGRPLPEDFLMRGQMIFFDYFPPTWFTDADIDEEEKLLQLPSMAAPRLSRILWNGICISNHNKWITYDKATFRFSITDYAKALEPRELPIISESGTLPTELEKMGQPALNFATATTTTTTAMTINTPSMSEKSDSMDFNYSGTPTSSRQVFTQPPKILKRGNKVETGPSAPVKATQVETMDTEEDMPDLSPPTA